MESTKHEFLHFKDGIPQKLLSEAAVRELLRITTPVVEPVTPAPEPVVDALLLRVIGSIGGSVLYLILYGDKLYLGQMPQTSPRQVVFRGGNAINRSDVRVTESLVGLTISGGITGNDGLDQPANLPVPDGYIAKEYGDGGKYFERIADAVPGVDSPAPIDQSVTPAPNTGRTGPMADPDADYVRQHADAAPENQNETSPNQ